MPVPRKASRKTLLLSLTAASMLVPLFLVVQKEQQWRRWQSKQEWFIREAVFRDQILRSPAKQYYLTAVRGARLVNPRWPARVLVVCDPDAGLLDRLRASRLSVSPGSEAKSNPCFRRPLHMDCLSLSTSEIQWVTNDDVVVRGGISSGVRGSESGWYSVRWRHNHWSVQHYRCDWVT